MADISKIKLPDGVTYNIKDMSTEIGGRNLLVGSYKYTAETPFVNTTTVTDGYKYLNDVHTIVQVHTGETYIMQAKTDGDWSTRHGGQPANYVTLWLVGSTNVSPLTTDLHLCLTSAQASNPNYLGDGKWLWTIPSNWNGKYIFIRVNNYNTDGTTSVTHTYWDFKLEKGSKTTDWSLAPEDQITGSGTSGYLTKFNGSKSVTNGPALGSDTTKFLRNDGTWATPSGSGNKIFTVQPTTPYNVGDLYIAEDNNILVCNTARSSGSYNSDDWGSAVNAMSTQEVSDAIDGDILVVTGNSTNGGNVILRLNNGIPYEVLITDTPTNITSSSAKIYRWDSSGLRYSSTGYNGTYTTILNSSGKIPTGILTGPLNANSFSAIQNFTAAMIHGGTLTRGASNNSEGTIELKNASGTVIAQVGNYGFKFYGPGAGDSRPYYVIDNSSNGIAGYTATGTLAFKIATDEFRMPKAYVATELNIGNMIKIVPTSNSTHRGISFVAAT